MNLAKEEEEDVVDDEKELVRTTIQFIVSNSTLGTCKTNRLLLVYIAPRWDFKSSVRITLTQQMYVYMACS